MTNFQQDNSGGRFAWLTPERALVVLPVAVGVSFALILGSALLFRFQSTINELTALEQERLQKRDEISALQIQYQKMQQNYQKAQSQTQLLQQLVTGNQSIETLLSQLNLEALESRVLLESYQPQRIKSVAPSRPKGKRKGKGKTLPSDPLLSDGVVKEQRLIVVSGSYGGLLEFLRRLERITPLLVISDLSIQADASSSSANEPGVEPISTMRLTLTAYSKQPSASKQPADAKPLARP